MNKKILLWLPLIGIAGSAFAQAAPNAAAAAPLSRAEVEKQYEGRFRMMDTNKDGSVSKTELEAAEAAAVKQLEAARAAKRTEFFNHLDANKDGQLSRTEFDAIDSNPVVAEPSANVIAKLDTNKDGKISQAEFVAPAIAGFNRLDTNKDGILSVAERAKAQPGR